MSDTVETTRPTRAQRIDALEAAGFTHDQAVAALEALRAIGDEPVEEPPAPAGYRVDVSITGPDLRPLLTERIADGLKIDDDAPESRRPESPLEALYLEQATAVDAAGGALAIRYIADVEGPVDALGGADVAIARALLDLGLEQAAADELAGNLVTVHVRVTANTANASGG